MKPFLAALILIVPCFVMADSVTDAYNAGAAYGKGSAGQGTGSLSNPGSVTDSIPGYTPSPPQSGYYGGVRGGDGGLADKGQEALQNNDAGQAVIDSGVKNPLPTLDPQAPYITAGKNAESSADSIVNGTGNAQQCQQTTVNKTVFERYTCERDAWVEQSCVRNGTAGGGYGPPVETVSTVVIGPENFKAVNRQFIFTMPQDMTVTDATLTVTSSAWVSDVPAMFMGLIIPLEYAGTQTFALNLSGVLRQGQEFTSVQMCPSQCNGVTRAMIQRSMEGVRFTITFNKRDYYHPFQPSVSWAEACGFSKAGAVQTSSVCTVAGGNRTVVFDGVARSVWSDCWQYTDQYLVKSDSKGTCESLMNNQACTQTGITCQTAYGAYCEHETVSYDCQKTYSSGGLVCGGQYFCKTGNCSDTSGAGDSGFDTAVAKLAGLASAADDVSKQQDGVDVRAFTGSVMSCRKAVAGFSNCCKDSGWGADAGLAACNSDEMALGKAKAKKVTVNIGERCDHEVLGVCVQKSKVYCVFGGKLARIIQEQGRRDQLHVGFGSGKNPDCRGITIPELQNIDFDRINFADFYEDLMNNQKVPDTATQVKLIKDRIAAQVNQQGGQK